MESTFHIDVGRRFVYWARVRYCFSGRIPGSAGRDGVSAWPRSDVFVRRRPALCRSLSAQERRDPDTVAVFSVRTNSQTRDRDEHGGTLLFGPDVSAVSRHGGAARGESRARMAGFGSGRNSAGPDRGGASRWLRGHYCSHIERALKGGRSSNGIRWADSLTFWHSGAGGSPRGVGLASRGLVRTASHPAINARSRSKPLVQPVTAMTGIVSVSGDAFKRVVNSQPSSVPPRWPRS
jgi:hypothetical protein